MAKIKKNYVCTECGADYPTWAGQCKVCSAWNTLKEIRVAGGKNSTVAARHGYAGVPASATKLSEVDVESVPRFTSGLSEFDRVLGGGYVPGSVVLLGGSPGAGKSTILLQNISEIANSRSVLYVSGEESVEQIADRARRLQIANSANISVLTETSTDKVIQYIEEHSPSFVVIDSIQTMYRESIDSAPGGVSQVRESAVALTRLAKQRQVTFVIVGHVTKDQSLAGPMSLAHICDTSLSISSTEDEKFRILRTDKNRFGATSEIGFFRMQESGLAQVKNPSAIFLNRSDTESPGTVITVLWEGTRPLLVELQALTIESPHGNPRRLTVGFDQNRLALGIAVLARHGNIFAVDMDIFLNVVGGVKIQETSADLAMMCALISSLKSQKIPKNTVIFGETGLNGEIRPVANGLQRIADAKKHGFEVAIVPKDNAPKKRMAGIKLYPVANVAEAIDVLSELAN
ncbi:MAG: DNA repair protein RadA [Candidatus Sedimenticola sp. (ex Thyasira tokunagai)]